MLRVSGLKVLGFRARSLNKLEAALSGVPVHRASHYRGTLEREREIFIDNLLVRVHHIDQMTWLTGLAPWEF